MIMHVNVESAAAIDCDLDHLGQVKESEHLVLDVYLLFSAGSIRIVSWSDVRIESCEICSVSW